MSGIYKRIGPERLLGAFYFRSYEKFLQEAQLWLEQVVAPHIITRLWGPRVLL